MQLHVARLCLDCEEIHEQQTCPVCSSESLAFISRWIPAPDRRTRPRQEPSQETAETYRQLLNPPSTGAGRWLKRGMLGVTAVALAGWLWRQAPPATKNKATQPPPTA
jgi:hypothetical protein